METHLTPGLGNRAFKDHYRPLAKAMLIGSMANKSVFVFFFGARQKEEDGPAADMSILFCVRTGIPITRQTIRGLEGRTGAVFGFKTSRPQCG